MRDEGESGALSRAACAWQGCGVGSSSERTRTAITAALRKKLKDLMGEFQDLRQRLQDEYRRARGLTLGSALG